MKTILALVLLLILLVGCGKERYGYSPGVGTLSGFHTQAGTVKSQQAYLSYVNNHGVPVGPVEGTPIVFNGKLYTVVVNSLSGVTTSSFRVDEVGGTLISSVPVSGFSYISAIVHNGTVYVFGTVGNAAVQVVSSVNLIDWTSPVTVYTSTERIYNTSVSTSPSGFVMAVEANNTTFYTRFLASTDLINWSATGGTYTGAFINCPTIRYSNGYYYMLYMTWKIDSHMTFITRSIDLSTWEDATYYPDGLTVPFAPSAGEGNNISDVDMVEHNGSVFFIYARGDQSSWLEIASATYQGSIADYFNEFW